MRCVGRSQARVRDRGDGREQAAPHAHAVEGLLPRPHERVSAPRPRAAHQSAAAADPALTRHRQLAPTVKPKTRNGRGAQGLPLWSGPPNTWLPYTPNKKGKENAAEILEFHTYSAHTAVSGQQRTAWHGRASKTRGGSGLIEDWQRQNDTRGFELEAEERGRENGS